MMSEHDAGRADDLPISYDQGDDEIEAALTRIYLAILHQPEPSRPLLVAQGIPGATVDRAIPILESRGMVTVLPDGTWDVIAPDIALPAHAVELERRARSVRGAARELAQIYFQARSDPRHPMDGLRVMHSMDEIEAASAEIRSAARASVLAMRDRSARTEQLFHAPMSTHRRTSLASDGGPLTTRITFDVAVLEIRGADEVVAARAEAGEKARFVSGPLPFSAFVVDDVAALVDLTMYDATGQGSLLVRSRPLVLGLLHLLESTWRRGVPLDRVDGDGLDRRDTQILSLLAAGASDATIARQSKISQRTVERRVRTLMDQLGAGTRFQAGVQAARRGWV